MSDRRWWVVFGLVAVITFLHYGTHVEWVEPHSVYRRLYYLPVVVGAFAGGLAGGVAVAALVTLVYAPHGFWMEHHLDPAPAVDKALEIFLYFGLGALTGRLVDLERAARAARARLATERADAVRREGELRGLVELGRGLAHELRNPLAGLQGALEIAAERRPDAPAPHPMLDVALRECERLGRVVTHFLEFARPPTPRPRPVDAAQAARRASAVLEAEAAGAGVSIAVQARSDTPRAHADEDQLAQILVNLLRNAIQASPPGGRVAVEVCGEAPEPDARTGRVCWRVCDEGPGVPAGERESIFLPYVSSREGGTGLGLPISAGLARRGGGTLALLDAQDRGACFELCLPAATEAPS